MAAGGSAAAKENASPSASSDATASAGVASRRHGVGCAVKSCGVKKQRASRARVLRRVPLRDITNLIEAIEASSPAVEPEASLGQEASPAVATELAKPDAVLPAVVRLRMPAMQDGGDAAAPAAMAARYSLLKGFR